MKKELKNKRGITLIALIVTIIVLLILAGVTIVTLTGENGLLSRAATAREKNKDAENDEKEKIAGYEDEIDSYVSGNREAKLTDEIKNYIDQKISEKNTTTTLLLEKTTCNLTSQDAWNPSSPRATYQLKDNINNYSKVAILMEHRPTSHTYTHTFIRYCVPKVENGIITQMGEASSNSLAYYDEINYSLDNDSFKIYRRWYSNWADLSFTIYGIN